MTIGFGTTEKKFEKELEEKIRTHFIEKYRSAVQRNYFHEDFTEEIRAWVDGLSEETIKTSDTYKKAINFPDRYSYFWSSMIADCNNVVFILRFHHINRRHCLSSDGWGMLLSEHVFYIKHQDC